MAWSKHWKTRAATVSRWPCSGIQRLPGSVMIFRALSLKDLLSRRAAMPPREERKAVKSIQDRRASRESDNVSDGGRGFEYRRRSGLRRLMTTLQIVRRRGLYNLDGRVRYV